MSRRETFVAHRRFPQRGERDFACTMTCRRCAAISARTGNRCSRQVCVGLPLCWQHTRAAWNVAIRQAGPRVGKGLFAAAPTGAPSAVRRRQAPLFRKGDLIVPYAPAEELAPEELDERYDYGGWQVTAPYAVPLPSSPDVVLDAACVRNVGSLANDPRGRRGLRSNAELTEENGTLWLRATRAVRDGDEILLNYGPDYWAGAKACGPNENQPCFDLWQRRRAPIAPVPRPRRIRENAN